MLTLVRLRRLEWLLEPEEFSPGWNMRARKRRRRWKQKIERLASTIRIGRRSHRLRVIEPAPPHLTGGNAGKPRVLCLCACGRTKIVAWHDILWRRAKGCSGNCRSRLKIFYPHTVRQRIHSARTGILRQEGPPVWDSGLRKGIFQKGGLSYADKRKKERALNGYKEEL